MTKILRRFEALPFPALGGKSVPVSRGAMAMSLYERLRVGKLLPEGVVAEKLLPDGIAQRLKALLVAAHLPVPTLQTGADAFKAVMGDADGDGSIDVAVDLLINAGMLLPNTTDAQLKSAILMEAPPQSAYLADLGAVDAFGKSTANDASSLQMQAEVTVDGDPTGKTQGRVRLSEFNMNAQVERPVNLLLLADGNVVPAVTPPPTGAKAITLAQLNLASFNRTPHVVLTGPVGVKVEFDLYTSGKTTDPRVSQAVALSMVHGMLAAEKAQLQSAQSMDLLRMLEQTGAQGRILAQAKTPTDRAEAVVWRAARLTKEQVAPLSDRIEKEEGVRPKRWIGWVDDTTEVEVARLVLLASNPEFGIPSSFLYSVAIGEGLKDYLDEHNDLGKTDVTQMLYGFSQLGVDTFSSRAVDLKKSGFLPKDFTLGRDYLPSSESNEKTEDVNSANFPDLRRGLIALKAMLADCRAQFLKDARQVLGPKVTLTERQVLMYTYTYFNAGAGFGKGRLQAEGLGFTAPWKGPAPLDNQDARYNALTRIASWRLINDLKVFPPSVPPRPPPGV